MLSKLTFSLALVLMLAFLATSAMAQAVIAPAKEMFTVISQVDGAENSANGIGVDGAAALTDMPDLDDLLRFGGSIELSIVMPSAADVVEADAVANYSIKHDADAAALAKLKHSIIISEIMWGRDASLVAEAGNSQWIEIYNHTYTAPTGGTPADALMIHFSTTKQAREPGTMVSIPNADGEAESRVILDQVSTINRFGGYWAPKGNGGNTASLGGNVVGANAVPPTDLVSMYRKVNLADDGTATYKVKKAVDGGGLDGLGDGTGAGSWEKSVGRNVNLSGGFIGSPSTVHTGVGGTTRTFAKTPASFAATGVIFNEVRNDTSDANLDWIELHHHADVAATTAATAQTLENWTVSIVTATKDPDDGTYSAPVDANLFSLPKFKLQPGEYLVVYNRDPGDTILAGGMNIEDIAAGTQVNKGSSHLYIVRDGLNLPSDKKFLLLLRNVNDKVGTHEKLVDYAGNGFFSGAPPKYSTDIWPFIAWGAPGDQKVIGEGDPISTTFTAGAGSWGRETNITADGVYRPDSRADNRMHVDDWVDFGFVGSGYDRDVDPQTAPGTPGYANVAVNVVADDQDNAAMTTPYAFGGSITISEVMYDAGPRWNLVQWIELYNSSMTETINLDGWTLEIRNKEDVESYVDSSLIFVPHTKVLPNQTLLIVSATGANDVDSNRVYNLYEHHRRELGLLARDSVLLSRTGFFLRLTAKVAEGGETSVSMVMDEAGNVDVAGATRTVMWALPARDPAARQSLVRQYGTRDIDGTADAANDGTMESSWTTSDIAGAGLSYYGHRNDVSTPGYRLGGPLPVSLSSFRPVRDKTTGEVVIKWVTESELNNAGFNILRSESKDGEFQLVNLKGIIAGNGTTSERHVYEWTDTAAKPNVVYYYQIEDVSLDGNRTALATTHLRGNVTVAGKATITWADLKSQK